MKDLLATNDVLDGVDSEACGFQGLHRLVWANPQTDAAFLIDMTPDPKWKRFRKPFRKHLSLLEDQIKHLAVVKSSFVLPAHMRRIDPIEEQLKKHLEAEMKEFTLDPDESKRKIARIEVIQALMTPESPEILLEHGLLGSEVAKAATRLHTPRWRVYQLLYRYWVFEAIDDALVTDYAYCGVPDPEKPRKVTVKLGRRNKNVVTGHAPEKEGVNAGKFVDLFHKGYTIFRGPKTPLARVYRNTIARFFNKGYEVDRRGTRVPILPPDHELPTYDEFRYWVNKKFDAVARLIDNTPVRKRDKDLREHKGSSFDDAPWPGHTYQIDSTVADLYLVSAFNRNWLIGRPILYFVVDTATGCIVGLHITLGAPSWNGARQALFNAMSDKTEWLAYYGFELEEGERPFMPRAPTPRYVRPDRGEVLSVNGLAAAKCALFDLQFPGPYRPDLKPDVERLFRTLKDEVVAWVPGAVLARERERGERDYRLDATLTLYEFTQIVLAFIEVYNLHAEKPSRLRDDAIRAEVPANPLPLFEWGLQFKQGSPRYHSEQSLFHHLLPKAAASVTARGIELKGTIYRPSWEGTFAWAVRAKNLGRWKTQVSYLTSRPDRLHWMDPDTGEYHILYADPKADLGEHAQIEDIVDKDEFLQLLAGNRSSDARQADADLDAFVGQVVKKAKKAKRAAPKPPTKTEQIADITANRAAERALQEALDPHTNRAISPAGILAPASESIAPPPSLNSAPDVLDYLLNREG